MRPVNGASVPDEPATSPDAVGAVEESGGGEGVAGSPELRAAERRAWGPDREDTRGAAEPEIGLGPEVADPTAPAERPEPVETATETGLPEGPPVGVAAGPDSRGAPATGDGARDADPRPPLVDPPAPPPLDVGGESGAAPDPPGVRHVPDVAAGHAESEGGAEPSDPDPGAGAGVGTGTGTHGERPEAGDDGGPAESPAEGGGTRETARAAPDRVDSGESGPDRNPSTVEARLQPDRAAVADQFAAARGDAGAAGPRSVTTRLSRLEHEARHGADRPVADVPVRPRPEAPTVERLRPDWRRGDPPGALFERGFNEVIFTGNDRGSTLRCSPSHEVSQHSRFSPASDPYVVTVRNAEGVVVWARPMTHVAEQHNMPTTVQAATRQDHAFDLAARAAPTAVGAAVGMLAGIPGAGMVAKIGVDQLRPVHRRIDVDRVTPVPFPHSRFAEDGYSLTVAEPAYAGLYREDPSVVRDLHGRFLDQMADRGDLSPAEHSRLRKSLDELPWDGVGHDKTTPQDREHCRLLLSEDGLGMWVRYKLKLREGQ